MEKFRDMSIDVISSLKSGRFLFSSDEKYAGALVAVTNRPIVNDPGSEIRLFRLEFEIFLIDEIGRRLLPTGGFASRDLVITPRAPADRELRRWAEILRVRHPDAPKYWYMLDRYTKGKLRRWVRIQFGDPDEIDLRQPFSCIEAFEPLTEGYAIDEAGSEGAVRDRYWPGSEVAFVLRRHGKPVSEDTVSRFVKKHAKTYGEQLVRQTEGGQRKINWYLCWHLWEAEQCGKEHRAAVD